MWEVVRDARDVTWRYMGSLHVEKCESSVSVRRIAVTTKVTKIIPSASLIMIK